MWMTGVVQIGEFEVTEALEKYLGEHLGQTVSVVGVKGGAEEGVFDVEVEIGENPQKEEHQP
jgi:predicted ThiF/HesA family dinucleotide-utilizing enzyme